MKYSLTVSFASLYNPSLRFSQLSPNPWGSIAWNSWFRVSPMLRTRLTVQIMPLMKFQMISGKEKIHSLEKGNRGMPQSRSTAMGSSRERTGIILWYHSWNQDRCGSFRSIVTGPIHTKDEIVYLSKGLRRFTRNLSHSITAYCP